MAVSGPAPRADGPSTESVVDRLPGPFDRRPVQLPTDVRRTGPSRVSTTIAVATLVIGVIVGAVYERFWQTASHEVERILPASTLVHVHGFSPPSGVASAMTMSHFAEVSATALLQRSLEQLPELSVGPFFDLFASADDLHFAMVPGPDALGFLVLVEVRDAQKRRRYEDRLTQLMEPVDRQLGFTIHALKAPTKTTPWAPETLPLRMVAMAPWVVFNFGSPETLTDLLNARVAGTTRPIRTRVGYSRMAELRPDKAGGVLAYLDPGALHDALRARDKETLPGAVIEIRRALLVDGIEAFTANSKIVKSTPGGVTSESLEVAAHFAKNDNWPPLTEIFSAGDHDWVRDVPADAEWTVSIALQPPDALGTSLSEIATRIQQEFGRALQISPVDEPLNSLELSQVQSSLGRPEVVEAMDNFQGLVRLSRLAAGDAELHQAPPSKRWLLAAKGASPQGLEVAAATLSAALARDAYAIGTLQTPDGVLHVAISQAPMEAELDAALPVAPPTEVLSWRVRGSLLEIAPHRDVFKVVDRATVDGRTLADDPSWSTLNIPEDAAGAVVMSPSMLSETGPVGAALTAALRPDFRLTAELRVAPRDARLTVNIGAWTGLIALARAPRRIVDRLVAPALPETCRDAFDAVCALLPRLPSCRLLEPRRAAMLSRACQHLTVAPPI